MLTGARTLLWIGVGPLSVLAAGACEVDDDGYVFDDELGGSAGEPSRGSGGSAGERGGTTAKGGSTGGSRAAAGDGGDGGGESARGGEPSAGTTAGGTSSGGSDSTQGGSPAGGGDPGGGDPGGGTAGTPDGSAGEGGEGGAPPNACAANPCEHGSCVEEGGGYRCECEPGYVGDDCELVAFESLGVASGCASSEVFGLSDDGLVAVGRCDGFAVRWTPEGMEDTGDFSAWDSSIAFDTSADGAVVVGYMSSQAGPFAAFVWTPEDGMTPLPDLPEGMNGFANGVTADGTIVVGGAYDGESSVRTARWTRSGAGEFTLEDLGPGTGYASSANGSIVVGQVYNVDAYEPARWDSQGVLPLGRLPDEQYEIYGSAAAISPNGSIVVGDSDQHPFRWTSAGGLVALGTEFGGAQDLSDDGSVIVGSFYGHDDVPQRAALWDAEGEHEIAELVAGTGADLTNWILSTCEAVTPDAGVVVGNGTNPSSADDAWVARLH